ncbi:MAG: phosphate/phosphite/phosphonate ABC transporter substrate-binding protein [Deltaproteobacteria bacterium]|nr:phosphate/phosphite/phosphonate ABC transporter substrate-binding protein [Deltaproteobacteria bacterium]
MAGRILFIDDDPAGREVALFNLRKAWFLGIAAAVFLLVSASPVLPAETAVKATVRFGVIPRFNPHVTYEYYQPLMDYLSRNTPYRFELRLGRTYLETIEDLRKGTTDVAYLGGATYAIARHRFGARALVKPRNAEGGTTYRCFIIVRLDSPVRTIQDLRGKSVAFGARRSTTGALIPSYLLFGSGVTPNHLKVVKNLHNHEEVAKAVLKGVYDAGAVKDVVAWKYEAQGLRIIAESEELPNAPIAAGPSLPKDAEAAMVKALLSIDGSSPGGKATLARWGPELQHGFVRARGEDYDFLYRKIVSIPTGCGIRCHTSNPFFAN